MRNAYDPAAGKEADSQFDQSEPTCSRLRICRIADSDCRFRVEKCKFAYLANCCVPNIPRGGKCISRLMRNPIKSSERRRRGLDRVAKCHGSRGYIRVKKWLNVNKLGDPLLSVFSV